MADFSGNYRLKHAFFVLLPKKKYIFFVLHSVFTTFVPRGGAFRVFSPLGSGLTPTTIAKNLNN